MKIDDLIGYWILKSREDSPEQDGSFSIGDRVYTISKSDIEILVFKLSNKCYHLGIGLIPEEEVEDDIIFDLFTFFPGNYDLSDNTIQTIDPGTMNIVDGNLHIIVSQPDYSCVEVWIRLPQELEDLRSFIDKEIGCLD